MDDVYTTLLAPLERAEPARLALAASPPPELLAALAQHGRSYHVRFESTGLRIELELGNGIITGARAHRSGEVLEGRAAYVLLRAVHHGQALVTPRRFLSMANILEPIHALPDLTKPTSAPPPRLEADTVELPALRPAPLPLELLAARAPAPPERSRAATRVAPLVALGILVAISSAAAVALAALREDREPPPPVEPIVAGLTLPAEPLALEPAAEDAAVAPEVAPADPRALARRARLHLRAGRHRAALDGAREAAALRPRSPYYQTLLGDAYAAHGRDVEARRAWRRALGLRAGYAPARARLAGET